MILVCNITVSLVCNNTGFQFDYVFDWTILKYQQSQIASAPPRAAVSLALSLSLSLYLFLLYLH